MQGRQSHQSRWSRGGRDTWEVIRTDWRFWAVEVLGGAVSGAIDGWLAVVWVVGTVAILWIAMTARPELNSRRWVSWADAAAIFYKKVSEDNALNSAKLIFEMESLAKTENGPSWALRRYIFNHGSDPKLKVRGRVKGGSNLLEVQPIPEDEIGQWVWDSDVTKEDVMQPDELRLPNGQEIV